MKLRSEGLDITFWNSGEKYYNGHNSQVLFKLKKYQMTPSDLKGI